MTTRARSRSGDVYVTQWELEQILEPLKGDVGEIKDDVKALLAAGSESRGAAAARKAMFAAMLMLVSAGWWLPDLIHRHP